MDAQRQKRVSALIQKELAALIAVDLRRGGASNLLISVTKVRVALDFSVAKIYLSIFPSDKANERLEQLQKNFPQAETFVIEVPNDNEALSSLFNNKAYRKNQHSSEHLFYFNSQTLRNIIESSKIEIQVETQLQRYTLANHFGWLKNQERGGQDIWEMFAHHWQKDFLN